MADYYPLLARAITALPENTGEARRTVYERARSALLAQLRGADPPLPDEEVTRERLALEEAIRRVETEYAAMAAGSGLRAVSAPAAERSVFDRPDAPQAAARSAPAVQEAVDDFSHEPPAEPPPPPQGVIRSGLAPRGDAKPRASEPRSSESPSREEARAERERPAGRRPPPARPPVVQDDEEAASGGTRWGRLVMLVVLLALIGGAGALGYAQRDHIIAMIRDMRANTSAPPPQEAQKPATPEVPKSTDRIAQAAPDTARRTAPQASGATGQQAMVAQRAVLFEENPGGGQQGLQQFVGNVIWRAETFNPGNGLPPDLGIRATVEIPDRQFKVNFTIRRNQDASLPASHIIEITFDLPQNFDLGNVANVPGMRAKASESAQGVPLIGLAVRVTPGFFLVGLSAQDIDRQRNLGLMITRNWLDLPMVFSNGRRGILALEKGVPGDQVFRQAYAAWGLPVPQEQPAQQ